MAGYGATTVLRPLEQPIDAPGPRYTTPSPRSLGSTSSTRRAIAFVSMLVGAGVVAMMVVHGGLGLADSSNMEQHSSDPKPLNALILGDSITASAGCQKGQQRCEACKNLKEDGGWVQIFEKLAPEMNIMSVGATGRGAIKPEHWEENKKCASPEAHHQSFWPKLADSLGHHYNGRPDVVFILFGTNDVNLFDPVHYAACGSHYVEDLKAMVREAAKLPSKPVVQLMIPPSQGDRSQCPQISQHIGSPSDPDGGKSVKACNDREYSTSDSEPFLGGHKTCMVACVLPSLIKMAATSMSLPEPIDAGLQIINLQSHGKIPMNDIAHPSCDGHKAMGHQAASKLSQLMQSNTRLEGGVSIYPLSLKSADVSKTIESTTEETFAAEKLNTEQLPFIVQEAQDSETPAAIESLAPASTATSTTVVTTPLKLRREPKGSLADRAMKVFNYWKTQHPDAPDSENPIVANGLYPYPDELKQLSSSQKKVKLVDSQKQELKDVERQEEDVMRQLQKLEKSFVAL